MKKIKQLLLVMVTLSFLLFGTLACTDDEKSTSKSGGNQTTLIQGKWFLQSLSIKEYINGQLEYEFTEVYKNGEYVHFHADYTFVFGSNDGEEDNGTYEIISSSKVIMTFEEEDNEYSLLWSFTATGSTLNLIYEEEDYDNNEGGKSYRDVIELTATR